VIRTNGDTILHVAAEANSFAIFEFLLASFVQLKVDITNEAGETPFIIGCREGHLDFIQQLMAKYGQKKKANFG
jgi:ankyrin repeat protein